MARSPRPIDQEQRARYSTAKRGANLTYVDIANRMGITPGPVSDWINGTAEVPRTRRADLEQILGLAPAGGTPAIADGSDAAAPPAAVGKARSTKATKPIRNRKPKSHRKFDAQWGEVPAPDVAVTALRDALAQVDGRIKTGLLLPVSEADIVAAIVAELHTSSEYHALIPYIHLDAALSETTSENKKIDLVCGQAISTRNSAGGVGFTGRRYVQKASLVCEVKIVAGKGYSSTHEAILEDVKRITGFLERFVILETPNAKGVVIVADPGNYYARKGNQQRRRELTRRAKDEEVELLFIGPYRHGSQVPRSSPR